MDSLTDSKRQALRLGLAGLILIVLSVKVMVQGSFVRQEPLPLHGTPAVLFFTLAEPCDCMQELTQQAEAQVSGWPAGERGRLSIYRIEFDRRRDLASRYKVYRVPSLVLVDAREAVIYEQDCWQAEGAPFNLAEFEAQIRALLD
jgi:hypothetical protein